MTNQRALSYVEEFMARESDELVKRGYCNNEIDSEGKTIFNLERGISSYLAERFSGKQDKRHLLTGHMREICSKTHKSMPLYLALL